MPNKIDPALKNGDYIRFMLPAKLKERAQEMYTAKGLILSDELRKFLTREVDAYDLALNR
jgi:hypothetical protein